MLEARARIIRQAHVRGPHPEPDEATPAVIRCATAMRHFLEAQTGWAIVNVCSHQARWAVRDALPYCTAKAAVEGLTRARRPLRAAHNSLFASVPPDCRLSRCPPRGLACLDRTPWSCPCWIPQASRPPCTRSPRSEERRVGKECRS